ncbi:MAG: SusC/RagA family TonB-linked outer membrane protein, partial [Bacteroidales bacterium]|nr:SusC/RagA family TonB-linked outer membrane protein [Bacteroidales bacterium]
MCRKFLSIVFVLLLAGFPALAQQDIIVTGTVKDTDGNGLDAATVVLKTGKVGVITDPDGTYSIKIPASAKKSSLVFSYLGKVDKEVAVGSKTRIDVILEPSEFVLEEAVVQTGYGVAQKRSDLTGSAFQVNSESLRQLPKARMDNILSGMVPGVSITTDNSNGRASVSVRVRGDASLSASSEPLWIVDGVPIYTGTKTGQVTGTSYNVSPFSLINPDDIESMTVLKDAATTTIYGADGANGVILVTTKSGSHGKTRISASVRQGISHTDHSTLKKMCTAAQWWELAREGWVASGRPIAAFPYQDSEHNSYSTTDTDWYGVYYGLGTSTDVSFSASGGSDRLSNYLSANYHGEKSSAKGNNQTRFSLRNKSTYNLGRKFSFTVGINGSYNDNDILSITSSAYRVLPIFSPYDEDGYTPRLYNYYSTSDTSYEPEMRKFVYSDVPDREFNDNNQKTITADLNGQVVWKPVKGLSASSQLGYNTMTIYENIYNSSQTLDGIYSNGLQGYSRRSGIFSYTMNNVNRVNYSNTFGRHSVSALGALELTSKTHRYLYASGYGFINDFIKELAYATSGSISGSSNTTYSKSLSYLAQLTYSFDKRYYLTTSWRRQGNSSFSTYARWGNFASVGLSYNMHNEKWFSIPWISTLKLKASYGNNGNSRLDTSSA